MIEYCGMYCLIAIKTDQVASNLSGLSAQAASIVQSSLSGAGASLLSLDQRKLTRLGIKRSDDVLLLLGMVSDFRSAQRMISREQIELQEPIGEGRFGAQYLVRFFVRYFHFWQEYNSYNSLFLAFRSCRVCLKTLTCASRFSRIANTRTKRAKNWKFFKDCDHIHFWLCPLAACLQVLSMRIKLAPNHHQDGQID